MIKNFTTGKVLKLSLLDSFFPIVSEQKAQMSPLDTDQKRTPAPGVLNPYHAFFCTDRITRSTTNSSTRQIGNTTSALWIKPARI